MLTGLEMKKTGVLIIFEDYIECSIHYAGVI